MFRQPNKRERVKSNIGFTLIELLIVIAIIGLLSSVVLASLNSARKKARDARRILDLREIQKALDLYASDNDGNYPPGPYYFTTWMGASIGWDALGTLLRPYMSSMPVDPSCQPTSNGDTSCGYWYFYSPSFDSSSIDGYNHSGGCLGKAVLMATRTESGSINKRDCQFDATLTNQYPSAIVIVAG